MAPDVKREVGTTRLTLKGRRRPTKSGGSETWKTKNTSPKGGGGWENKSTNYEEEDTVHKVLLQKLRW